MNKLNQEKLNRLTSVVRVLIALLAIVMIIWLVLLSVLTSSPSDHTEAAQHKSATEQEAATENNEADVADSSSTEADSDSAGEAVAAESPAGESTAEESSAAVAAEATTDTSEADSADESDLSTEESVASAVVIEERPEFVDVLTLAYPSTSTLGVGQEITFSGTGEPGSELEIVANGNTIAIAMVDDEGFWKYTATFDEAGEYKIQAGRVDRAELSETIVGLSVLAPVVMERPAFDLPGIDLGNVAPGASTELVGTGEPGSEVDIVANGEVVDTVTVGADGRWAYDFTPNEVGDYELVIRSADTDGRVTESNSLSMLVEATIAEPETLTVIEETVPLTLDELAVDDVTTDETVNLSGTGIPGSEVQIIAGGDLFGIAAVRPDNTWVYALAFSNTGEYDILVQVVDEDDSVIESTEAVTVSVLARKASENFAFIFPADGGEIIVGRLNLIGTGDAGLEVEILAGESILGTTEIQDNGEWYFSVEPELGQHTFSARLVAGDNIIGPLTLDVMVAGGVDCDSNLGISRGDNYIVGTCNTFGTVIERTGVDLESLIAANTQIENPDLIYPGDVVNIP